MAKRSRKSKGYSIPQDDEPVANVTAEAMIDSPPPPVEEPMVELKVVGPEGESLEELTAIADVEEDNAKPNSVVHPRFKDKYLANARALGIPGKAAKRSNWDWLSQQIAAQCLTEKHKLKVDEFYALMESNGVDASRWTNRNKGWEGRLRMTGRVALQKRVANAQSLRLLDGTLVIPPEEFVAKYRDKE